jgi:hypothetical protein
VKRVVFTVATGASKYGDMAKGLAQSLSLLGDTTPRVLISDIQRPDLAKWFDQIVVPNPSVPPYMRKLEALSVCDADAVLFIDSDSLAFRRLDEIWEYCEGKPLAVQGYKQREGHWYGYLEQILPRLGLDYLPRFNGGMIYYERGPETERLIAEAHRVAASYQDTGLESFRGEVPDEPCISIAMARTGVGELIPDDMDFMNTAVGLVGKLRMDVMKAECSFIKRGRRMRLIRPMIFHAAKYVNNTIYWKQLATLEWLERYEERHPYGYMSFAHKLRRSMERRLLRLMGKL